MGTPTGAVRILLAALLCLAAGAAAGQDPIERIRAAYRSGGEPAETDGDILVVHFIDVGHGDAALVRTPSGRNILVDTGTTGTVSFVLEYLQRAGVERIDLLICTHPHGDHIGGAPSILRRFGVGTVLDSGREHTTRLYEEYLRAVRESGPTVFRLGRAGQGYAIDGAAIAVLHPGDALPRKLNNCSIVCRLSYGRVSFLFTGDAEEAAERQMLRNPSSLKSTVLKVGHHGSRTSTSAPFLRAVAPELAIVSCREANRWTHPHDEVIGRLRAHRIRTLLTADEGSIVVETDGEEYAVRSLGKRGYPD